MNHVFQDYVTVDNRIWFSNSIINGLFSAEEEGGQAELVKIFPEEGLFQCRLYTEVYAYNYKLIFIPYSAKNISIYNILDDSFIQIEPPISKQERKYSSFVTVQNANKIFLFNDYMQNMAVLNVNDYTIKIRPIPMREKISSFLEMPIRCVIDDCAYMALENLMVTLQMSSDQVFVRKICESGVQFACVRYNKNAFWIMDRENQLYNYQDGSRRADRKLKLLQENWNKPIAMVKDIFFSGDSIWFVLHKQNYLIRLNISTMEKEKILYENTNRMNGSYVEYSCYNFQKQQVHILLQGEERHRVLDLNTGAWSKITYETKNEEIKKIYQRHTKQLGTFRSETAMGKGLDIIQLLIDIQNSENDLNIEKNCGRKIFQYLI